MTHATLSAFAQDSLSAASSGGTSWAEGLFYGILSIVVLVLGLALYFLPSIGARERKHHASGPIFFLNLFLGWTVVGWVVAFIWAYSTRPAADGKQAAPLPGRVCLKCGALLSLTDRFCTQCGTGVPARE